MLNHFRRSGAFQDDKESAKKAVYIVKHIFLRFIDNHSIREKRGMKMKGAAIIGVVCFARKTFDYEAAREIYENIKVRLGDIENVTFYCIDELVIEIEDARKAAATLLAKGVDACACISGTFHLGHLPLEIYKVLQKPLLLWGLPELPYDGGKIRLNSLCGVQLNASNLYKAGIRNYHPHVGETIDEDWIDAVRVRSALQNAHVGVVGSRAHGFFNIDVYDPALYRATGVLVDHYEISDIINREITDEEIGARKYQLTDRFDVSSITEKQLTLVAALAAKLNSFLTAEKIDALAIRCWPEMARDFGIAPCASMSLLQSEDSILACEGDIDGALSMLAHRAAGAETPYLFDFSQINLKENYALLWHCGVAPCNLHDGKSICSLDSYFAGGRGVTADFVLREGEVSILRFDSAGDRYRVFLQKARGVPMEKELKGTYLKVLFEGDVQYVLEKMLYNGIAHHASMVYGTFIRPFEILARIQGWDVIK